MCHKVIPSLICLNASLYADNAQECCFGPRPMRATIRHIEGKGIGYSDGYTSLDLFFSAPNFEQTRLPFLDLRGHVFDNGKFALNGGVGYRQEGCGRIWGVNAYYDNRWTHRHFFNQIGLGAESLGKRWDFRMNGYLPLGHTNSRWYGAEFGEFAGNRLFVRRKQQIAMKGLDGEAALHLNQHKNASFDLGAGPYFFQAHDHQAYGGKLRAALKYKDLLWLEVSGSYDNVFHGIVQGQVGLSVPFGPRPKTQVKNKEKFCCPEVSLLKTRIMQPVQRQEIIVLDKRHHMDVAIDPSTGLPYNVIFVDNQSHSDGTFESPYPTFSEALAASAPGDILYIFPGDGSSIGLTAPTSNPFQLLDDQQVLGAGTVQYVNTTLGKIEIPKLANQMPHFAADTSGAPTSVMFVANNNMISGLHMTANGFVAELPGQQIYCIGSDGATPSATITHIEVTNNLLEAQGGANGISFANDPTNMVGTIVAGTVIISNNELNVDPFLFMDNPKGIGVAINYGDAFSIIENNLFTSTIPGDAFPFQGFIFSAVIPIGTPTLEMNIRNNTFDSFQYGLFGSGNDPAFPLLNLACTLRASNNTFTNISIGNGIDFEPGGTSDIDALFENNQFVSFANAATGVLISAGGSIAGTFSLIANHFSNTGQAILCNAYSPNPVLFQIQNNQIQFAQGQGTTVTAFGAGTLTVHFIGNQTSYVSGNAFDIEQNGSGLICLRYTDNYSPTAFSNINRNPFSPFQVEPLLRNIPQPNTSSILTPVPENTCN